jgi:hypothetical protein
MSRFVFIAFRVSFLAFGIITFKFVDRLLGLANKQRAGMEYQNACLACIEILIVLAPLSMIAASYGMLRLLDARHRWAMLFLSALGITGSIVAEVSTKDNLLLAASLFLIPQIPIALGKNRRADGWPMSD